MGPSDRGLIAERFLREERGADGRTDREASGSLSFRMVSSVFLRSVSWAEKSGELDRGEEVAMHPTLSFRSIALFKLQCSNSWRVGNSNS
jgi:hypothetical protein